MQNALIRIRQLCALEPRSGLRKRLKEIADVSAGILKDHADELDAAEADQAEREALSAKLMDEERLRKGDRNRMEGGGETRKKAKYVGAMSGGIEE